VPLVNLDLHEAVVQDRSRAMTMSDVDKGIDLNALAFNTSGIPIPTGSGMEAEEIEAFVDGFFNALDAVNEYGDGNEPVTDDEMLEGFGDAPEIGAESVVAPASGQELLNTIEAVDGIGHVEEESRPGDNDQAATMDNCMPANDESGDAEKIVASGLSDSESFHSDYSASNAPLLDLSVLEKPVPSPK
jgi:type IV secretion system protein VirD4